MDNYNNSYFQTTFFKRLLLIVLAIPIINVVATIAVGHISGGFLNPGTLRAGVIFFLFIFVFSRGFPSGRVVLPTYFLILFMFLACFLSTSFFESFYVYLRFVIASLLFVVAYMGIKTKTQFALFNRVIIFVLAVQIVYVLLSNIFQFGSSDYLDESFYFGETGVNITKEMVVAIFSAPLFYSLERSKGWRMVATVLFVSALIIVLIGLKRAALLSVGAGMLIYFLLSPQKARAIRIILFASIFLVIISPYFIDLVYDRFEARSKKVSMSYEEIDEDEGRVQEINIVWDSFLERDVVKKMVGNDPFLMKDDYFGIRRMIHIDYLSLLDGGGIIGLFLYLWVYFAILYHILIYSLGFKNNGFYSELKTIGITLIVIQLIMGLAGTITGIGLRGLVLLYLGAICGVLQHEYQAQRAVKIVGTN